MKYYLLDMTFGIMAESQEAADHMAEIVKEKVAGVITTADPEEPGVFEMFSGMPYEDDA